MRPSESKNTMEVLRPEIKYPKVSIIILNYNGKSYLGELLDKAIESAIGQVYPNKEVLFVDNNSSDDSCEYVRNKYEHKVKCIRFTRNYGYCLGNNLAVKYVAEDSKYLLFMNPDVILKSDYISKLVSILENNSKIAMIQGLEKQPNGYMRIGGVLNVRGDSIDLPPSVDNSLLKPVLFVFGAAMLIRRRVFEKVGGFSSEFFLYYDEADLSIRVRCYGYEATGTVKTSYIHHVSSITSRVSELAWYYYNRNRWLIILRYFYGMKFLYALLWHIYLALINITIRGFHERFRVRLTLRILRYIIKRVRREIINRKRCKKYRSRYEYLITSK